MSDLNNIILKINIENDKSQVDKLICDYKPFIVKTVADAKHQYVSLENDEEYSIGLLAFVEAIEKYDADRGNFIPFAKLVINSRVKNYIKKEKKFEHADIYVLENNLPAEESQEESDLKYEILRFEEVLNTYGITFEDLIDSSPKHKDTRKMASGLAKKITHEQDFMEHLNKKKRLPISKIAERFLISIKIIKRSKQFIIATIIIITENLTYIKEWIKN